MLEIIWSSFNSDSYYYLIATLVPGMAYQVIW